MVNNISVEDKVKIIKERISYINQKNELLNSEENMLKIDALNQELSLLTQNQ